MLCTTMPIFFPSASQKILQKTYLGSQLEEKLWVVSFMKAVPKGLKLIECEHGVGGQNSPVSYILILCRMPLSKPKIPPTSSRLFLTLRTNSRWQFGWPGLLSSSYCMYAPPSMHASRWGLMWTSKRPKWLSNRCDARLRHCEVGV